MDLKNLYQKKRYLIITFLLATAVSLSLSFLTYVYHLQSYGISAKRISLGILVILFLSLICFAVTQFISKKYYRDDPSRFLKAVGFWMLMALLLIPQLWPTAHYPLSPLFQQSSDIKIIIRFVEGGDDPVQLRGVWLDFDDKKYSSASFSFSDEWVGSPDGYFLDSNLQGELSWHGKIGEKAKLTIFPMSAEAVVTVLWDGEERSSHLTDSTIAFNKKSATPIWYYVTIAAARATSAGYLLFLFFTIFLAIKDPKRRLAVACLSLFLISLVMVYLQFQTVEEVGDQFYLQVNYHQAVISGQAPSPWQYRVFSEWLIEGLVVFAESIGLGKPYYFVFALVRVVQSIGTYFLLFFYYRKLGFSNLLALTGAVFATGSLFSSFLHHGFSINSYFDVIFYLGAALMILGQAFAWLPPLMVLASLNRETSGLIPLLALEAIPDLHIRKRSAILIFLSIFAWGLVFIFLRFLYPARELFISYGYSPGLPLLGYNLSPGSFPLLFRFFGLAPLFGLLVFRRWPIMLRRFFAILIPIWFLVHLFASVITETRLFFVPQFLVFVPSFLVFVQFVWEKIFSESQME